MKKYLAFVLSMSIIGILFAPATVLAHGPVRLKLKEEIQVAAPAAKIWDLIKDFCTISNWHPGIEECVGQGGNEPGATRALTLTGGATLSEELLKYEPEKMKYKYKISEYNLEVLPVSTYSAFLYVTDNGDGSSTVTWKGGFYRAYPNNNPPPELNDDAANTAVLSIYTAGLANIKKLAEE